MKKNKIKMIIIKSLNISLTSGTVVSYGVFIKTGGLSFMSETRTIIGIFRLRLVDLMVHAIYIWKMYKIKWAKGKNGDLWLCYVRKMHKRRKKLRNIKINWLLLLNGKHNVNDWLSFANQYILGLTWKTMWLKFSASRSSGCNSCSCLPFSRKIGFPLGNISSSAISVYGSP